MEKDVLKDIQFLLIRFEGYIEDTSSREPWEDEEFLRIANKYGFTKENIHKGFENLRC